MDKLWAWLKQANARAVFLCALGALGVVAAWWAWEIMRPIEVPNPPAPVSLARPAYTGLGLLALLDAQQAAAPLKPLASPFASPERRPAPKPPPPPPPEKVTPSVNAARPPEAKPAPVTVTMTYRGMLQRADGVRLALIEDSLTKQSAFCPAGTNLYGLRINQVDPEQIELVLKDHSVSLLKRGVPRAFPKGHHAD